MLGPVIPHTREVTTAPQSKSGTRYSRRERRWHCARLLRLLCATRRHAAHEGGSNLTLTPDCTATCTCADIAHRSRSTEHDTVMAGGEPIQISTRARRGAPLGHTLMVHMVNQRREDGHVGADPTERVDRLEREVARLQSELVELRARVDQDAGQAPESAARRWAPPRAIAPVDARASWPGPHVGPYVPSRSAEPSPPVGPALILDSEKLLKWGGVALVVLAVGFAVSTAISRGWIGPELQLAGALIVSFALIGTGLRLRPTRPAWTHALCSGGVLALFTTVASDLFVDQSNDSVAFVSTVAIGLGALALARSIGSEWVGLSALAGGVVAWLVIGRDDLPFHVTVAWMTVLLAATLVLAVEQRWPVLRLITLGAGLLVLLGLAGEAQQASEQTAIIIAAALLAATLFRVPSIGDLSTVWQQLEVQLSIAATPWLFAVVHLSVLESETDRVTGAVAIGIAAIGLVVAFGIRPSIRRAHFISLLVGASITLSIGLAVLLSTTAAFVALSVQGAGLVVLSRSFDRNIRMLINAAVLSAVAATFTVRQMLDAWTDDVPIGDDVAHAAIIVATAAAAWLVGERIVQQLGALAVLALVLIWLGSVLVHLPQGQAVVSVCWAVVGISVFVTGAIRKLPEVGVAGLAVIGLTVGKLLTVDLREVDTLWRAGLFFIVGIGIMRLGFLLPRLTSDDAEPAALDEGRQQS